MESPVDDFSCEPGGQVDHETDELPSSPSHGPELLCSDNETDDAHESCMGPTTELDLHFPIDETTGGEVPTPQISGDPYIEFDDSLRTNEQSDLENQANNISDSFNLRLLCARTLARARSILASAMEGSHPNHVLMSSLHTIRLFMARLLVVCRISREGSSSRQNAK
jgi:hypothetical protein